MRSRSDAAHTSRSVSEPSAGGSAAGGSVGGREDGTAEHEVEGSEVCVGMGGSEVGGGGARGARRARSEWLRSSTRPTERSGALSEASGSVHCNEARVWAACACISRQLVSSPMAMSAVSKCCARPAQLGEGEGEGEDEVEGEVEGKGEE